MGPAVLILDDWAMRELTAEQAEDWYPLFPNKVVGESLLDRLINNSYQVFMDGPSYRPNKRPGAATPGRKTSK